ncbi:hypothetical protein TNCV_782391 [Trichonephila clavipes]|nr:hypothetical protein TNCV_782391 [Trichonephila clavipes]
MMEAGWSTRQVTREVGRSDLTVRKGCDRREIIYTATRLRVPSTDQSSRILSHLMIHTRRANYLIGCCPDPGSIFTTGRCAFPKHRKAPE